MKNISRDSSRNWKSQIFRLWAAGQRRVPLALVCFAWLVCAKWDGQALAQRGGPPRMRIHSANEARELDLVPADVQLNTNSEVEAREVGGSRVLSVNSIPEHTVGRFPNRGNPHRIEEKDTVYRFPREPRANRSTIPVGMNNFGVAVNGVLFDPAAAELYMGNIHSQWRYEALGGAVPLGLDDNFAHVQPDGKYHYHGLPVGLLKRLGLAAEKHSPIVGYAADGFPVYALYGFKDPQDPDSDIVELTPSYQLKEGQRPGGARGNRNASRRRI